MRIVSESVLAGRQFIDRPHRVAAAADADAWADRLVEAGAAPPDVSVVVPILNEQESIGPLYAEVKGVMDASGLSWEMVVVDDGSADASIDRLRAASAGDRRITIIEFSRRFGQTS